MTGVDYPVLVAGLLRVVRGGRPLAAVQELLGTLVAAVGAESGAYAEFTGVAGRVVAATPGADWAIGRPVDRAHPSVVRLADGDCLDLDVRTDLPPGLADQLTARGLTRVAAVGVLSDGRLVGSLHLYFRAGGRTDHHRDVGGRTDGDSDGPTDGHGDGGGRSAGHRDAGASRAGGLSEAQRAAVLLGARLLDRVCPTEPTARAADNPLATALADGLAVLGPGDEVRSWNPAAHVLTGIPAAAAIGRRVPFDVPAVGEVGERELPDGRWIQVLCSVLADSADRVVTFRDVTEARRREQVKDLYVATTSHELRTPVTAVHGHADTLHRRWDQLDDTARRDSVRRIWERSGELSRLVDRLLAAGDGERIDALLTTRPFDLVEALDAAVRGLGAEETARLRVELPDRLPRVMGDAGSVPTVLAELVQNAHKYSPDGGEITLTAGADERTAYFRVADRGIGIRPEYQELAFEPRWQAEGTDRRRFGGVGLGLYLVRRIVEGQHGWVSLRRRNPDGTVAEVRLPRAGVTSGEA
jgi:signal transduction histidine kinase